MAGLKLLTVSESDSPMSSVQIEQKSYDLARCDGISVAHFVSVADID